MNRPVVLISLESPHSFWRLSSEHERALELLDALEREFKTESPTRSIQTQ